MSDYELFNGLNARSYAFCVHFRKLCHTCWIHNEPQTDPGLLLTNKWSTKSDTIDTYYKEPSIEDSSSIFNNDGFYYADSDDKEVKPQNEEANIENANYTLKTGIIITSIQKSIYMNRKPITAVITMVNENCDNEPYPLIVHPRELVYRTTSIKAKGK